MTLDLFKHICILVFRKTCCAGPLPQGVEALLIHSDNVEPSPVQLSLTAECPKVGLSLELAEDWHSRTSSFPDALFYHLEAAVKGISADLRPTGTFHACPGTTMNKYPCMRFWLHFVLC